MIILLLLACLLIVIIEVPSLVKKKMWRELVVFSVLLVIGMVLAVPQVYGIRLFNPNAPWLALFKPMVKMLTAP